MRTQHWQKWKLNQLFKKGESNKGWNQNLFLKLYQPYPKRKRKPQFQKYLKNQNQNIIKKCWHDRICLYQNKKFTCRCKNKIVLCPRLLTLCRLCWNFVSHIIFQRQTYHTLRFTKLCLLLLSLQRLSNRGALKKKNTNPKSPWCLNLFQ